MNKIRDTMLQDLRRKKGELQESIDRFRHEQEIVSGQIAVIEQLEIAELAADPKYKGHQTYLDRRSAVIKALSGSEEYYTLHKVRESNELFRDLSNSEIRDVLDSLVVDTVARRVGAGRYVINKGDAK